MTYNINDALNQIAAKGKDMTQATAGGGDYKPPAEGTALARFIGYFELGKHNVKINGVDKVEDQADLVFELHGKNYPASDSGEPIRMTLRVSVSQNEKSWMYKTFSAMNWEGTAKHITQLLGDAYLLNVKHRKVGEGADQRTFADIERGSVRKPFFQQMNAEGEVIDVRASVPAHITPLKLFVWPFATPGMWDSIRIDGEYPERKDEKTGKVLRPARSKNVIQDRIRASLNFKGLSIYEYAVGTVTKNDSEDLNGVLSDAGAPVNEPEQVAASVNEADPMASIG